METVNVARDFTTYPGGRLRESGRGSGQEFREKFLIPALDKGIRVKIELDGTSGYPPSFLEEAFGGLVRLGYKLDKIADTFEIEAGPAYHPYKLLIENYLTAAAQRKH